MLIGGGKQGPCVHVMVLWGKQGPCVHVIVLWGKQGPCVHIMVLWGKQGPCVHTHCTQVHIYSVLLHDYTIKVEIIKLVFVKPIYMGDIIAPQKGVFIFCHLLQMSHIIYFPQNWVKQHDI